MTRVMLYCGTFDPAHVGHIQTANELKLKSGADEVWAVVNTEPRTKEPLLATELRRELCLLSFADHTLIKKDKHHTWDMLLEVQQTYPDYQFHVGWGSDCIDDVHNWIGWKEVQRIAAGVHFAQRSAVTSSTEVRELLAAEDFDRLRPLVHPFVFEQLVPCKI